MKKLRTVLSQGSWVMFQHLASRGLGVVVFYGISVFVEPHDLGLMGLSWVFIAVCDALLGLGMPTAFLRKQEIDERDRSTLFWGLLGCGLIWTLISLSMAPVAAWVFDEKELLPIILILSLRFPLRALDGVPLAITTRNLEFKKLALLEFVSVACSGVVGVTMAYLGFGVWSLVARHLVGSIVSPIILYSFTEWRPRRLFSKKVFKEYLSFGVPLTLSGNVGWLIALQIEQAVIGGVLGPAALGLFNFAKKPIDIVGQVATSVRESVLIPLLVRRKRESGEVNGLALTMYVTATLLGILVIIFFEFLFPYHLFAGSKWSTALVLMPIFGFVLALRLLQQVFLAHLTFLGEVKFLLLSALLETTLYGGSVVIFAYRGLNTISHCMLISVLFVMTSYALKILWVERVSIVKRLNALKRKKALETF